MGPVLPPPPTQPAAGLWTEPPLRVKTPQKRPCLVPQTFQGAYALALAVGSIPGPLLNCFCKEKCNFNIYIMYI